MGRKVLLIGRNQAVLTNLASALVDKGFEVRTTNAVEQAGQNFSGAGFDLIAFGRGVDETTNTSLRNHFQLKIHI